MISLTYPYIPPSLNATYKVGKWGSFYKDEKAVAFKEDFISWAKEHWFEEINKVKRDTYDVFHLHINFYFHKADLINERYGKDKRIKSPYKRLDLDNRIKTLQDCLSGVLGIDDTRIFSLSCNKLVDRDERIEIYLEKVSISDYVEQG